MGGEQHGRLLAVGEPVHQLVELPPGHRVEAGSGLVEEQQLGPPDDADRDVEPPPLPAGQVRDPPVRLGGEPDQVDQLGVSHGREISAVAYRA